MKKLTFVIPIFFSFLFPIFTRAEVGCLVPGYKELLVLQSSPGAPFFNEPNLPVTFGCEWVLVSSMGGCIGHGKGGVKGVYEMQCPLDDYVLIMLIFTIGTVFLIRGRPT